MKQTLYSLRSKSALNARNRLTADCITAKSMARLPARSVTTMSDYNGWKNRQTWNVSMWINNDESMYRSAVKFMEDNPDPKNPYMAFIINQRLTEERTPDKIAYISSRLDYKALNAMMKEMVES